MQGLPSILSLFCNKFNKLNNTGAQMSDSKVLNLIRVQLLNRFTVRNMKEIHAFVQLSECNSIT